MKPVVERKKSEFLIKNVLSLILFFIRSVAQWHNVSDVEAHRQIEF